jgi:glutathione S-transferase
MPLQRQAEYKRAGIEEGIGSPAGKEATKSFMKLLKWIEESTEKSVWLAGPDYSLADIAAIPYMMRLEMLRLARLWDHKRASQRGGSAPKRAPPSIRRLPNGCARRIGSATKRCPIRGRM